MTFVAGLMPECSDSERAALDKYIQEQPVEETIQSILQSILEAKPDNPREWLLNRLEQEMAEESDELTESELHRLYVVTQKITSEIMPQETIAIVISETRRLLRCDTVSLFVLDKKTGLLRLHASNLDTVIAVSPGQGVAGTVFNTKEIVNIADCYQDRRFDRSFDEKSGYLTKSLLAAPIVDFDGSVVGVLQAINKLPSGVIGTSTAGQDNPEPAPFTRNDQKILLHFTQHVNIALRNSDVYQEAISQSERATGLLNTIQSLSQDLGTQSLLLTITMHANKVVSAQRCTVFLLDEQVHQLWSVSTDTGDEIRISSKTGIAGLCCSDGKVINISDAYADSRFNQEVDKKTGFRTKTMLAIPVFEDESDLHMSEDRDHHKFGGCRSPKKTNVIGVIQMINKVSYDGDLQPFLDEDVEVMELFAKIVGPKLTASSMVQRRNSFNSFHLEKTEGEMALQKPRKDFAVPPHAEFHCRQSPDSARHFSGFSLNGLTEEGDDE